MAFKEVASLDAEVTVALGKKDKKTGKPYPKQAEGYYLGSRTVENKRGESVLHFLQTPNGNLGIWGTTDLNRKLGRATPGVMVRITSTGTKPTPNGDMYTYKVETDEANIIEVSAAADSYANDTDDSATTDDSDMDQPDGTNDDVDQEAALAQAERQAKVQAMLNKGKASKTAKV